MKKSLAFIMAAATALSLSACQDEPDNPETTPGAKGYDAERLISTELSVTRNNADFTLSVNAYCNTVSKNADYSQNCAAAAAQAMEKKFMCDSFALAIANTYTNNKAVIEAGSQRTYDEFPSQFLFTQEKLETKAAMYNKKYNKKDFFVITGISDLDAAAVNFVNGITAPPVCSPN
jgi:membrane-bound lytic murein transglycosylase